MIFDIETQLSISNVEKISIAPNIYNPKIKNEDYIFSYLDEKSIIWFENKDLTCKGLSKDLNDDIRSENRMFRLLQGDVGSGKTILGLIAAANVIESNYQVALMAPTEILAEHHYDLAKKVFAETNVEIELLTGKKNIKEKKLILQKVSQGNTKLLIGTHSLFQKSTNFKNLGLIIIDEQHKFGVKQRIDLQIREKKIVTYF